MVQVQAGILWISTYIQVLAYLQCHLVWGPKPPGWQGTCFLPTAPREVYKAYRDGAPQATSNSATIWITAFLEPERYTCSRSVSVPGPECQSEQLHESLQQNLLLQRYRTQHCSAQRAKCRQREDRAHSAPFTTKRHRCATATIHSISKGWSGACAWVQDFLFSSPQGPCYKGCNRRVGHSYSHQSGHQSTTSKGVPCLIFQNWCTSAALRQMGYIMGRRP